MKMIQNGFAGWDGGNADAMAEARVHAAGRSSDGSPSRACRVLVWSRIFSIIEHTVQKIPRGLSSALGDAMIHNRTDPGSVPRFPYTASGKVVFKRRVDCSAHAPEESVRCCARLQT